MDYQDNDLSLITTEVLLEELLSRFDHAIFSGLRCHDGEQMVSSGCYTGNIFTCIGLAHKIAHRALSDWNETGKDIEREDL